MCSRWFLSGLAASLLVSSFGASAQDAPPSAAPSSVGASPYARLLSLPDISAIGSFAAAWNDYDVGALSPRSGPFAPANSLEFLFQEVELSLRAVIDPYARADIYVALRTDGASVEEAFVTTTSLPAGLQVKAGQLRSPFGRINGQHPHTWDFVDGPLAAGRLVADESLAGAGLDLSWLAPLPWFAELHVAAQSTAPVEGDPRRLTGVARLAQFFPLTDETTLGVGLSAAARDEGASARRILGGADLYLRWRPPATRTAVTLQGELFGRHFSEGSGGTRWGGYSQLFWRVGPAAGLGVRYDQAPVAGSAGFERRYSGVATWFLSEFQRLRVQIAHDVRVGGWTGFEALLQAEFGIGAHGAHPF
jgi:hypothetical protein